MSGSSEIASAEASGGGFLRYPSRRLVLPALAVAAAGAAMVVLATQATGWMLDYDVGIVPAVVPWLAACLSVAVAIVGWSERRASSAARCVPSWSCLLLVGGAAALIPVLSVRRARQVRCPACRRVLPGKLDSVPRWPIVLAVVFALPYPVLRVVWALGGTFGTTGEPLDLEPVVAGGPPSPERRWWPSPPCCSSGRGQRGLGRCWASVASCWGWR